MEEWLSFINITIRKVLSIKIGQEATMNKSSMIWYVTFVIYLSPINHISQVFYFFNLTNPDDVRTNAVIPKYATVGPYIYRRYRKVIFLISLLPSPTLFAPTYLPYSLWTLAFLMEGMKFNLLTTGISQIFFNNVTKYIRREYQFNQQSSSGSKFDRIVNLNPGIVRSTLMNDGNSLTLVCSVFVSIGASRF